MPDSTDNLGQAGEDTSALIAAADADRNARARAQRMARKKERLARDRGDLIRVTINSPHKAQCDGHNLALTIASSEEFPPKITGRVDCPLKATLNGSDVEFSWGTINGMQPVGFVAGGATPFTLSADTGSYFYATSKIDTATVQWDHTQTKIIKDTVSFKDNTSDTVYELLCSVGTDPDTGEPVLSGGDRCGNIQFNFCLLL